MVRSSRWSQIINLFLELQESQTNLPQNRPMETEINAV
jgi:hypothetical protein